MMNDLKAIRAIALTCLIAISGAIAAGVARGTIIEGFTPTGQFRTVGVSDNGELRVAGSTSVAAAVFFLSSQPVNAFQAGTWLFVTTPSTATVLNHACATVDGGPSLLVPTNTNRKGVLICSQDLTLNAWIGNAGVNNTNAPVLPPGACINPDEGAGVIYTGPLFAYTTAPVGLCYYEKNP